MKSLETAEMLYKMRGLLRAALEANDVEKIKQYDTGLRFAKDEHIKALEQDLSEVYSELKKKGA